MLQKKSLSSIYCSYIIATLNIFLLMIAFIRFHITYIVNGDLPASTMEGSFFFTKEIFFVDFYVFFAIFLIFIHVLIFSNRNFYTFLSLILTLISANLCLYTVKELFSVKVFIFLAWTIAVSVRFTVRKSLFILLFGFASFLLLQFHPNILGIVDSETTSTSISDFIIMILFLLATATFFCLYRIIILKWQESEESKDHLIMAMSQMSVINRELQEYAKNRSEKAAEEERLRITRDMHDSCGYVFVNIISLMQACVSSAPTDWSRTVEVFEMVRNLASQGLQETRQTLRAIRDIQSPVENSLDSLYQIKGIFQKVTGMEVVLDKGNMKNDYGRAINKILIRTMQEGLTNSVKHGHASLVSVYFRDDGKYIIMTIKDNGNASNKIIKGIGFSGMEERLKDVGGQLQAGKSAEGGFKLEIKIPLLQATVC